MLIFVYGDDTFRVQEKVTELREAFSKKFDPTGLNTAHFPASGQKLEAGSVLQSIGSAPFLSEKRLVVIRDLLSSMKFGKAGSGLQAGKEDELWQTGLSKIPSSTIVILWETLEPKELEKKALFKSLKAEVEVHHYPFPLLEGSALNTWVMQRVKERGGQIAPDALKIFVESVGPDLWQMNAEIEKLIAYASGSVIERQMVQTLVRANFDDQIFALVDAASERRSDFALRLLQEQRAFGASDGSILSMFIRQVRLLLGARALLDENPRASQADFATLFSLHPFVAGKVFKQARSFRFDQLKTAHDFLYRAELGIKNGRYSDELATDLTTVAFLQK